MASLSSAKPSCRPSSALPADDAARPRWELSRRLLRDEARRGVVGRLRGDLLRARRCEGVWVGVVEAIARGERCSGGQTSTHDAAGAPTGAGQCGLARACDAQHDGVVAPRTAHGAWHWAAPCSSFTVTSLPVCLARALHGGSRPTAPASRDRRGVAQHIRTTRLLRLFRLAGRRYLQTLFMSLRARPLPRFPRSSASCATRLCLPAHRAWNRQPRFKPSLLVACASQAYPAHPRPAAAHPQTSGTGLWTVAVVLGIGIGGALLLPLLRTTSPQHTTHETATPVPFAFDCLVDSHLIMAPNTPAGRVGTLTPDEERKLRQLWALTLQVFGVAAAANDTNGTAAPAPTPVSEAPVADAKKDKKKSRLSVFKRSKGPDAADVPAASEATTPTDISKLSLSAEDDKHGQNADFKAAIANMAPAELRTALWSMVKHDHPDALLLRFLRARKWDVEKALIMMISTMHWRLNEMHVDDDIVKNGELAALQNTTGDAKSRKNADDFLAQLRMGKSFLHGLDADGRPLCFVRARLHKAGEQTEESLERFTVHTIETARMLLRPPIDTAVSMTRLMRND